MSDYGDVAVRAVTKLHNASFALARQAWDSAAAEVFPHSQSMQAKGCPRTTFLTLCAKGAVKDIPAQGRIKHSENATHAEDCLALLARHPDYVAMAPRKLWDLVTNASGKTYNQQMHVILRLARDGLLVDDVRTAAGIDSSQSVEARP